MNLTDDQLRAMGMTWQQQRDGLWVASMRYGRIRCTGVPAADLRDAQASCWRVYVRAGQRPNNSEGI